MIPGSSYEIAADRPANRGVGLAPGFRLHSMTERLFLLGVRASPVPPTAVDRNSYGVLFCRWDCPCADIGSLWASITPREIILSTRVSHCHFGRTNYLKETISNRTLKRWIVRDSLREVSRFLRGEIAVSITYNNGKPHSYGWCRVAQLSSVISRSEELFGPGLVEKAWNWSGEITAPQ